MLHMKWLALHHCLWEWSSGEALGSLGQPLWFVLMFWFHNPNILRAVICSLFPFYSVILPLFFFQQSKAVNREEKQLEAGDREGMEEERDGKKRAGWREGREWKVKQRSQNWLASVECRGVAVARVSPVRRSYMPTNVITSLEHVLYTLWMRGCTRAGIRSDWMLLCQRPGTQRRFWTTQTVRCLCTLRGPRSWGSIHHVVGTLQLIITVGSGWRYRNDLYDWIRAAVRSSNW